MKWFTKWRQRRNLKMLAMRLRLDHDNFLYDSSAYVTLLDEKSESELQYQEVPYVDFNQQYQACAVGYGRIVGIGVPRGRCLSWKYYQKLAYGVDTCSDAYNFLFHQRWTLNGDSVLLMADRIDYYVRYGVPYCFKQARSLFDPCEAKEDHTDRLMKDWIVNEIDRYWNPPCDNPYS